MRTDRSVSTEDNSGNQVLITRQAIQHQFAFRLGQPKVMDTQKEEDNQRNALSPPLPQEEYKPKGKGQPKKNLNVLPQKRRTTRSRRTSKKKLLRGVPSGILEQSTRYRTNNFLQTITRWRFTWNEVQAITQVCFAPRRV